MRLVPTLAGRRLVPHTGLGNARRDKIHVRFNGIKARSEAPRNLRSGRNVAMLIVSSSSGVIAAIAAFVALSAPACAQDKVWKHGLINAKSDAGIFLMVSTRDFAKKQGLQLEISQFKDDQLALKALIAGELDS